MASSTSSFITLSPPLATTNNKTVKFSNSFAPQSIFGRKSLSSTTLRCRLERQSEQKLIRVRCDAGVAEKEAEDVSEGEKFEYQAKIRIKPDPENGIIAISDTGIGMTKEELVDCLGNIAQSGTSKFLKAIKENKDIGADNAMFIAEKPGKGKSEGQMKGVIVKPRSTRGSSEPLEPVVEAKELKKEKVKKKKDSVQEFEELRKPQILQQQRNYEIFEELLKQKEALC